jgi:hypothetical protein
MVITRVGPLSLAKVAAILYAVIGLIGGAFLSLFYMAGSAFGANADDTAPFAALFGAGAIVVLPICYAIFGFIGTLIMAWLFNIAVGMVGGIEVDAR